jgi:trimethylamine--corrinoid protein Co-methyltransferase
MSDSSAASGGARRARRGGGGADARRASRRGGTQAKSPYISRRIPFFEPLSQEGLEIIEHNAETVLEEIGIEFRDDAEALEIWKEAGADVEGERVFAASFARRSPRPSPSMRATRRAASRLAATTPSSPRSMGRRSFMTWKAAGATPRSRTSGTS